MLHGAEKSRQRDGFDDLLVLWLKLLRENADVREEQQRRFQFILVDEYQDTNRIQGELIICWPRHHNVMVGGRRFPEHFTRGAALIFRTSSNSPSATKRRPFTGSKSTTAARPEILKLANAASPPTSINLPST